MSVALAQALHRMMDDAQGLRLEPVSETHRDGLRAACAADADIWTIYPYSMAPEHFDATWPLLFMPNRLPFAVIDNGTVVGTSSFFLDSANAVAEIGGTYIQPDRRGTGVNKAMKLLMMTRAFDSGIETLQFRVDARNARSRAAVLKLGAQQDGIIRGDRLTWTGHRRDTVVFSILKSEWPEVGSVVWCGPICYPICMTAPLTISCAFDPEAGVWFVANSDIPGLVTEAPSMDILDWRIRQVLPELIADNRHALPSADELAIQIHFERPVHLAAE